jgi:hypothetical protein
MACAIGYGLNQWQALMVVLVKHRQFNEAGVKDRFGESGALTFCGFLG